MNTMDYGGLTDRLMAYRNPQVSGTTPWNTGSGGQVRGMETGVQAQPMGMPDTARSAQVSSDTLSPPQMGPQPSPEQQQRQMTPLRGNTTPWSPFGGGASPMGSALMPGTQQGFQPQPQQQQPPQQSQWWGSVMGGGLADKFKGGRGGFNAAGRWARNK
jgi:hypothetical protein